MRHSSRRPLCGKTNVKAETWTATTKVMPVTSRRVRQKGETQMKYCAPPKLRSGKRFGINIMALTNGTEGVDEAKMFASTSAGKVMMRSLQTKTVAAEEEAQRALIADVSFYLNQCFL